MPIPSSVDMLPEDIRGEIDRLLLQRVSVDQIVNHLRELYGKADEVELPSRSGIGRYAKRTKPLRERILRSRALAVGAVGEDDDAPASKQTQVLIELMQSHYFEVLELAEDEHGKSSLTPKALSEMGRTLKDIVAAARGNLEFIKEAEDRAAKKATRKAIEASADKAAASAREAGLSKEQAAQIRRDVLGLRPPEKIAAAP